MKYFSLLTLSLSFRIVFILITSCGECDTRCYDVDVTYEEGDPVGHDPCQPCVCSGGEVTCAVVDCYEAFHKLPCPDPIQPEGQCCKICPNGPQCDFNGTWIWPGESVTDDTDPCKVYTCDTDGQITHATLHCAPPPCDDPCPVAGECCMVCDRSTCSRVRGYFADDLREPCIMQVNNTGYGMVLSISGDCHYKSSRHRDCNFEIHTNHTENGFTATVYHGNHELHLKSGDKALICAHLSVTYNTLVIEEEICRWCIDRVLYSIEYLGEYREDRV